MPSDSAALPLDFAGSAPLDMIAAIDHAFLTSSADAVHLGIDAPALEALLHSRAYSLTDGQLKRAAWNKVTPFALVVEDLIARPVHPVEVSAFSTLLSDREVARMLVNLPHPIDDAEGQRWIAQRAFKGRLGFQLGLFHENRLIGSIGISALSNALVYFLAPEARGKGYAKRILQPFVVHVCQRWNIDRVFAGVFQDNPASRHILEQSGFKVIDGLGQAKSLARDRDAPFWEMEFVMSFDHPMRQGGEH